MNQRWYDPSLGRFINRDPRGLSGGFNLYGYADNNPIGWTDPVGAAPKDMSDPPQTQLLNTLVASLREHLKTDKCKTALAYFFSKLGDNCRNPALKNPDNVGPTLTGTPNIVIFHGGVGPNYTNLPNVHLFTRTDVTMGGQNSPATINFYGDAANNIEEATEDLLHELLHTGGYLHYMSADLTALASQTVKDCGFSGQYSNRGYPPEPPAYPVFKIPNE